jgi:hypothetical protein
MPLEGLRDSTRSLLAERLLDKSFFDKPATCRGYFMTLSRPANNTTPAFSYKLGI